MKLQKGKMTYAVVKIGQQNKESKVDKSKTYDSVYWTVMNRVHHNKGYELLRNHHTAQRMLILSASVPSSLTVWGDDDLISSVTSLRPRALSGIIMLEE